jgi:Tfp pilus assembly protein PilV
MIRHATPEREASRSARLSPFRVADPGFKNGFQASDEERPMTTRATTHARAEDGLSLVELIVAALILIIAVVGIFTALESAGRAGADERHRGTAYQLAQQDQTRLRAMKAASLLQLDQTRQVTVDDVTYSVRSTVKVTTDTTGSETCDTGTASADYLSISSTVTWPRMDTKPVTISSIITPASGSFDPDTGALAVSVLNGQGLGVPNVPLSGTGAGSFTGTTGDAGCLVLANLPAGSYNVTPTASGLVNENGVPAGASPAYVPEGATGTKVFQLDRPGSINVTFQTKPVGQANPVDSASDRLVVFNTGMSGTSTGQAFGTAGTRVKTITGSSLFPFSSPDTVYSSSCPGKVPPVTSPLSAVATAKVNAGGPAVPATVTLPNVDLTVRTGSSSSSQGNLVPNAKVVFTDSTCSPTQKITLSTNSTGKLPDPGLPYGTYSVCVSGAVATNTYRMVNLSSRAIQNPNTPVALGNTSGSTNTVYLNATGSTSTNSTGCT